MHVSAENRQTQAKFDLCGMRIRDNADVVGATNILSRGMKMLEGQDMADASARRGSLTQIACEVSDVAMPSATGTR